MSVGVESVVVRVARSPMTADRLLNGSLLAISAILLLIAPNLDHAHLSPLSVSLRLLAGLGLGAYGIWVFCSRRPYAPPVTLYLISVIGLTYLLGGFGH